MLKRIIRLEPNSVRTAYGITFENRYGNVYIFHKTKRYRLRSAAGKINIEGISFTVIQGS